MKKIIITSILLGSLALFGCSRMEPEIVEYDPSYKAKEPNKLDRSKVKTPPLDLLNKYVVFANNNQEILATFLKNDDGSIKAGDIKDAEVVVRLSSKRDKDLTVKITEMTDKNEPATYKTVVAGENKLLPADMYTLSAREVTFIAGEVEQKITVSFDKEKIKELEKQFTYVVPLIVELPEEPNLSDYNFCLFSIKPTEIEEIREGQNVSYNIDGLDGSTLIPYSSISAQTTFRQDVVGVVIDGQKSANWWVKSYSDNSLTLTFPMQRVKGIKIYSNESKNIRSIDIAVSNTKGDKFVPQGTLNNPNSNDWWSGSPTVILFDKPYEIDAIQFSKFEGNKDWVNVTEIEIYY